MPTHDPAPDDGTTESRSRYDRRGAVAGQVSADRLPALSQELTDRLRVYGSLETIAVGDLLYYGIAVLDQDGNPVPFANSFATD